MNVPGVMDEATEKLGDSTRYYPNNVVSNGNLKSGDSSYQFLLENQRVQQQATQGLRDVA